VLYGFETWAMTEQMKSALKMWQRKTLRKIYGPITDQNGWRIRINDEFQVLCIKPNIVTTITVRRRLEWVGHLVRMSRDGTVKKVFLGRTDGRRKVGRPKLRWLDCIENDLKFMGVKKWRKKAEHRTVWAIILKEALVKLEGPYANVEEDLQNTYAYRKYCIVLFNPLKTKRICFI
jgi:hypothetical protein